MLRNQPTDQTTDLKEVAGNCAEQGRTSASCASECDPVACARIGIIPPSCRAEGARLVALEGSDLANSFYCWKGQSGARHVCRVIPIEQEPTIADYVDVVAIAVQRRGDLRRPLCVLSTRIFDTAAGRAQRAQARIAGCTEWHVYFGDDSDSVQDLTAGIAA
ncbi:MAG: hypothetical protein KDJ25_05420 [Rhodoblastus sp.]|nr:hypothetical protein [Rhodoblastus sp.]